MKIIRILLYFLFINCSIALVPDKLVLDNLEIILTVEAQQEIENIQNLLIKNTKYFNAKLEKVDLYFPFIEKVLAEEKVPDDFKYLCVMESSLVADAVSSSNAVGFWQFKKESAVEVGMRVDNVIDERKNIVSSSRGAAKYLKRSNATLNNWIYTTLSYNLGLGGTKRIMPANLQGVNSMTLDGSTHRYILKFIAHKLLFEKHIHQRKWSIELLEFSAGTGKTLEEIANTAKIDLPELQKYNVWLNTSQIPEDRPYSVFLPVSDFNKNQVMAALGINNQSQENQATQHSGKKHWWEIFAKDKVQDGDINNTDVPVLVNNNGLKAIRARNGDNSHKLAIQGKIRYKRFLKYNELQSFEEIIPGNFYYLEKKKESGNVLFHVVNGNEKVWDIAQKYGMTTESLLQKNRMEEGEALVEGRKLYIKYDRPDDELVIIENPAKTEPIKQNNLPIKVQKDSTSTKVDSSKVIRIDSSLSPKKLSSSTLDLETDVLTDNMKCADYLNHLKINLDSLLLWNPESKVKIDSMLPKGSSFLVKKNILVNKSTVLLNNSNLPPIDSTSESWIMHEVQAGESLYKIARQYQVSVSSILELNEKTDTKISIGEKLKVKAMP